MSSSSSVVANTNVVCFDIGIKNLAYCHLEKRVTEGDGEISYKILGWENVNLTKVTGEEAKVPISSAKICYACKVKVSYEGNSCKRHTLKPPLVNLEGVILTTLPTLTEMRSILEKVTGSKPKASANKAAIVDLLRKHYALPLPRPSKGPKAAGMDMSLLHDRLRDMVIRCQPVWKGATKICVENQPMLRPQMKSVQMLLFATLRDLFAAPSNIPVRLVHAGKKVAAVAGAEGYADRKRGAVERVADAIASKKVLGGNDNEPFLEMYKAAAKKDDLADAFCMALDALLR